MDKRIFVEKKADFQVKSESLVRELQHNLGGLRGPPRSLTSSRRRAQVSVYHP